MFIILLACDLPFLVKTNVLLSFPLSSPVLTLARCSAFLTRERIQAWRTLDLSWENQS